MKFRKNIAAKIATVVASLTALGAFWALAHANPPTSAGTTPLAAAATSTPVTGRAAATSRAAVPTPTPSSPHTEDATRGPKLPEMTAITFPAMGGKIEVQLPDGPADGARRIEALFAEHERAMSRFLPDSELCAHERRTRAERIRRFAAALRCRQRGAGLGVRHRRSLRPDRHRRA